MTVAFLFIILALLCVVMAMAFFRKVPSSECEHDWQVETRTIFSSKDSGVPIANRTVKVCRKCGACQITDTPIKLGE
jgi:hypothetical protein